MQPLCVSGSSTHKVQTCHYASKHHTDQPCSYPQPTLSKVFDDPGMRPRKWVPDTVRRAYTPLTTQDIEGAQSRPKDVFPRPRDTNPLNPDYKLPTPPPEPAAPELKPAIPRDTITAKDIDGAQPKPLPPPAAKPSMDVTDIEGSNPGWKPPFR